MRSKIDDYLDIEIPEINGKNGIGRKIALWKIRRNKPGKDAIYMIRFYLENRGKKGLKKFCSNFIIETLILKGIFCFKLF